tara:strand:+ start:19552 stop:20319 length:768 start_codon:yes stop_codon:yes gene_type:complete
MPVGSTQLPTGTSQGPLSGTPFEQEPDQSYYETPDQFIKIPTGIALIGEGDDSHSISINSFEISKFPVTNLAYQRFIEQTNHTLPSHWHRGFPEILCDHPVVEVNWYDAIAYCKWLSDATGVKHRIPTEIEWERAARGVENNVYPWGNSFNFKNCNCWELGVGWTTPVNCFLSSASSFGVLDMVGNVWEWCSTLFIDYPYKVHDGREDFEVDGWRVLRGGSWMDHEWGVRAARRLSGNPIAFSHNTGFRVIREIS